MRKIMIFAIMLVLMTTGVSAKLVLDDVHFDPAVIASGDEVDIIARFHDEITSIDEDYIGDDDYKFKVLLEPDDRMTEKHVIMQDPEGEKIGGMIYPGQDYSKRFTVKVKNDAPAGNYEFRLVGRWFRNGEPLDGTRFVRFKMPVEKEGIIIDISTIETVPSQIRPGDENVKIETFVENTGLKDAKSVEVNLNLPEELESSYSGDNRRWVGRVNKGESKKLTSFIDVDEEAEPGIYNLVYDFTYMDLDSNQYKKTREVPLKVKPRPYLEVQSYEGEGLAGGTGKLRITVKNTGTESAESVDVRLLKQNSQPFDFDVRSNYLGELKPAENGTVEFDIDVMDEAAVREHDFKVLIRSKGDSDEGDDNIYTYARRARFDVTGEAPNTLLRVGIGGFAIVLAAGIGNAVYRRKRK